MDLSKLVVREQQHWGSDSTLCGTAPGSPLIPVLSVCLSLALSWSLWLNSVSQIPQGTHLDCEWKRGCGKSRERCRQMSHLWKPWEVFLLPLKCYVWALLMCWKQTREIKKMVVGHWKIRLRMQHGDAWAEGNQPGEPQLLLWDIFQTEVPGWETETQLSCLTELRRQKSEFGEAKATGIYEVPEYQRRSGTHRGRTTRKAVVCTRPGAHTVGIPKIHSGETS